MNPHNSPSGADGFLGRLNFDEGEQQMELKMLDQAIRNQNEHNKQKRKQSFSGSSDNHLSTTIGPSRVPAVVPPQIGDIPPAPPVGQSPIGQRRLSGPGLAAPPRPNAGSHDNFALRHRKSLDAGLQGYEAGLQGAPLGIAGPIQAGSQMGPPPIGSGGIGGPIGQHIQGQYIGGVGIPLGQQHGHQKHVHQQLGVERDFGEGRENIGIYQSEKDAFMSLRKQQNHSMSKDLPPGLQAMQREIDSIEQKWDKNGKFMKDGDSLKPVGTTGGVATVGGFAVAENAWKNRVKGEIDARDGDFKADVASAMKQAKEVERVLAMTPKRGGLTTKKDIAGAGLGIAGAALAAKKLKKGLTQETLHEGVEELKKPIDPKKNDGLKLPVVKQVERMGEAVGQGMAHMGAGVAMGGMGGAVADLFGIHKKDSKESNPDNRPQSKQSKEDMMKQHTPMRDNKDVDLGVPLGDVATKYQDQRRPSYNQPPNGGTPLPNDGTPFAQQSAYNNAQESPSTSTITDVVDEDFDLHDYPTGYPTSEAVITSFESLQAVKLSGIPGQTSFRLGPQFQRRLTVEKMMSLGSDNFQPIGGAPGNINVIGSRQSTSMRHSTSRSTSKDYQADRYQEGYYCVTSLNSDENSDQTSLHCRPGDTINIPSDSSGMPPSPIAAQITPMVVSPKAEGRISIIEAKGERLDDAHKSTHRTKDLTSGVTSGVTPGSGVTPNTSKTLTTIRDLNRQGSKLIVEGGESNIINRTKKKLEFLDIELVEEYDYDDTGRKVRKKEPFSTRLFKAIEGIYAFFTTDPRLAREIKAATEAGDAAKANTLQSKACRSQTSSAGHQSSTGDGLESKYLLDDIDDLIQGEANKSLSEGETCKEKFFLLGAQYGQLFIAFCIFANALFMGFETDMGEENPRFFFYGELLFVIIFSFELMIRIFFVVGFGDFFWENLDERYWNWFDSGLVLYAVIDLLVVIATTNPLQDGNTTNNSNTTTKDSSNTTNTTSSVTSSNTTSSTDSSIMYNPDGSIMRHADGSIMTTTDNTSDSGLALIFRTIRILRLMRIIRLIKFFRDLLLLVVGLANAVKLLMWVWLLLVIIIFVFGIIITRTIGQPFGDNNTMNIPEDNFGNIDWDALNDEQKISLWMGTVPRAMFTLFEIMTTESWADIANITMKKTDFALIIILIYMMITTFAMVNVVVAVTVNSTLDSSAALKEDDARKARRIKLNNLMRFCQIFNALDINSDGVVSREEFHNGLNNSEVKTILNSVGFDSEDAWELFDIIDRDDNQVLELVEFCTGLYRATNEAKGRDLLEVHCDLWKAGRREHTEIQLKFKQIFYEIYFLEQKILYLALQMQDKTQQQPIQIVQV